MRSKGKGCVSVGLESNGIEGSGWCRELLNVYINWKKNKAGYTATEVACGWAGAVSKHANSIIRSGAVLQQVPKNAKNVKKANY